MATISEDYCSKELSLLLDKKGFDGYSTSYSKLILGGPIPHSVAMKWLREVHKLHITILWDCGAYVGKNSFCYHIDRIDNYEDKGYNKIGFNSYEDACEAAIKYCLENLI